MHKDQLQTEDYRPGALGGPAEGSGLESHTYFTAAAASRYADSPRSVVFSL